MSVFYSDDPVADFHCHDNEQCQEQERHRIGRCAQCGEDIHDYDDYYDFDGDLVCDECVIAWIAQYKK